MKTESVCARAMFITSVVTKICHDNGEPTLCGGSAKKGLCFNETIDKVQLECNNSNGSTKDSC